MQSTAALIVRLAKAREPDRRLDSEIVAAVLGPPGCTLDPMQMLDGWDILHAPSGSEEPDVWRQADDVPVVTSSLEAAWTLVEQARPHDAVVLIARALRQLEEPAPQLTLRQFDEQAGRAVMLELLCVMGSERVPLAMVA